MQQLYSRNAKGRSFGSVGLTESFPGSGTSLNEMRDVKSFRCAHCGLSGIELLHINRKNRFTANAAGAMSSTS